FTSWSFLPAIMKAGFGTGLNCAGSTGKPAMGATAANTPGRSAHSTYVNTAPFENPIAYTRCLSTECFFSMSASIASNSLRSRSFWLAARPRPPRPFSLGFTRGGRFEPLGIDKNRFGPLFENPHAAARRLHRPAMPVKYKHQRRAARLGLHRRRIDECLT